VSDDEATSLEVLEGLDKGGERTSVQVYVVGRLVKHDEVRSSPGGGSEDDLDLLSSGETSHGVVGGELGLETKFLEMLLDLLSDEGLHYTESLGLSGVKLENWGGGRKREQNGWVSTIG
jgi:hypothetical protein